MQIPDLINSLFEGFGVVSTSLNILKLWKDREVKGVYWPVSLFYSSWGAWNCYFYAHLSQTFSLVAGALLAIVNSIWVILAIKWKST